VKRITATRERLAPRGVAARAPAANANTAASQRDDDSPGEAGRCRQGRPRTLHSGQGAIGIGLPSRSEDDQCIVVRGQPAGNAETRVMNAGITPR
jgi:hypothetical protein